MYIKRVIEETVIKVLQMFPVIPVIGGTSGRENHSFAEIGRQRSKVCHFR